MSLRSPTYDSALRILEDKSDEELLDVLGGPSRILGDTAWGLLGRRNRHDLVVGALRDRKITRRDGKVRALNLLLGRGRRFAEAFPIYMQYASDRSADAASCALFGLAFWQDTSAIPVLEALYAAKRAERVKLAIEALKSGDPKIYDPYFYDSEGVWKAG